MKRYVKKFDEFVKENLNTNQYTYISIFSEKAVQDYLISHYDLKLDGLDNYATSMIFSEYEREQIAFREGMKKAIEFANQKVQITKELIDNASKNYSIVKHNEEDQDVMHAFKSGMEKQIELLDSPEWVTINQKLIDKRTSGNI